MGCCRLTLAAAMPLQHHRCHQSRSYRATVATQDWYCQLRLLHAFVVTGYLMQYVSMGTDTWDMQTLIDTGPAHMVHQAMQ